MNRETAIALARANGGSYYRRFTGVEGVQFEGDSMVRFIRAICAAPVPAASVQPDFDTPLRKAVRQMTLALNENEWADLLTTDSDATALEHAIQAVLERAGMLGDVQPDIGRDAALTLILRDVGALHYEAGGFDEEDMLAISIDDLREILDRHMPALATQAAPEVASACCPRDTPYGPGTCAKCLVEVASVPDEGDAARRAMFGDATDEQIAEFKTWQNKKGGM